MRISKIAQTETDWRQAVLDSTPQGRLNGPRNTETPLSPDKQKWLNQAYGMVRAERDHATDPRLKESLTNILATLILVDGE